MKHLKFFESFNKELDYDYILDKMKSNYGWGDLSPLHFQEFESSHSYSGTLNNDDYVVEFNKYLMYKK